LIISDSINAQIESTSRKGNNYSTENIRKELLIQSIVSFIVCHINLNNLDEANKYYEEGISVMLNYTGREKRDFEVILLECLNEINFYSERYPEVIAISDSIISNYSDSQNSSVIFDAILFKGLSLLELDEASNGYGQLLIADSIFVKNNLKILPYRRLLYSSLLNYYENEKDISAQIKYLNRLISWDSISKQNYRYFESDMNNNFETPKLLAEKERLIRSLEEKNSRANVGFYGFFGALLITVSLLGYYINRQRIYKKRYETLAANISSQTNTGSILTLDNKNGRSEISVEVVDEILEHLNRFELKLQFLSQGINLHDLAKSFKTNPNYLSRVINLKMEKNFTQYINDLRIVFIMNALKQDNKLRKYSIKAIANECGFSGSDAFTRAFYKLNGIYPSFYLKQLNKEAS